MPFFSDAAIRIQPYFGYRNTDKLVISARALRSDKPDFKRRGRWQAIRTMIAQFASREVADLPVTLELASPANGKTIRRDAMTNAEGFVRFEVDLDGDWTLPAETSWEVVSLRWNDSGNDDSNSDAGKRRVEGHVLAPAEDAELGVISDIDDTIIETGITGSFRQIMRNWQRVVAQLPEQRIAVPGADAFYGALGGGTVTEDDEHAEPGKRIAATKRPFFYISSSPWNLFSYLVSFKRLRNLPLGPVMLRDWGFDRETLGSSSHGAHKARALRDILAAFPQMRFALIGDDTQGDLPAYGEIAAAHPDRVAAIFIRSAGVSDGARPPEQIAAQKAIEAAGVPFWLGGSYDVGQDFLNAAGLGADDAATKIVEAAKDTPGAAQ